MSLFLIQNTFTLRRLGVVIFADITKIVTFLLIQSLKTQEKLKELETVCQNAIYICISSYSKICNFW